MRLRSERGLARAGAGLALLAVFGVLVPVLARRALAARHDLQGIVQQQCLPDWVQRHDPAPCLAVRPPSERSVGNGDTGYALLADRKGGAHFLLIPLRTVSGIESPSLLGQDAPNDFAAAWEARSRLVTGVLRSAPADAVGLAVNSRYSRGQDQLHIHIECQGGALHAALRAVAPQLGTAWRPLEVAGERYQIRRVTGSSLQQTDPFRLLAEGLPAARAHMGLYTLIVAGMQFEDGSGFALLARRAVLRGGERLLDSTCALAQAPLR